MAPFRFRRAFPPPGDDGGCPCRSSRLGAAEFFDCHVLKFSGRDPLCMAFSTGEEWRCLRSNGLRRSAKRRGLSRPPTCIVPRSCFTPGCEGLSALELLGNDQQWLGYFWPACSEQEQVLHRMIFF